MLGFVTASVINRDLFNTDLLKGHWVWDMLKVRIYVCLSKIIIHSSDMLELLLKVLCFLLCVITHPCFNIYGAADPPLNVWHGFNIWLHFKLYQQWQCLNINSNSNAHIFDSNWHCPLLQGVIHRVNSFVPRWCGWKFWHKICKCILIVTILDNFSEYTIR